MSFLKVVYFILILFILFPFSFSHLKIYIIYDSECKWKHLGIYGGEERGNDDFDEDNQPTPCDKEQGMEVNPETHFYLKLKEFDNFFDGNSVYQDRRIDDTLSQAKYKYNGNKVLFLPFEMSVDKKEFYKIHSSSLTQQLNKFNFNLLPNNDLLNIFQNAFKGYSYKQIDFIGSQTWHKKWRHWISSSADSDGDYKHHHHDNYYVPDLNQRIKLKTPSFLKFNSYSTSTLLSKIKIPKSWLNANLLIYCNHPSGNKQSKGIDSSQENIYNVDEIFKSMGFNDSNRFWRSCLIKNLDEIEENTIFASFDVPDPKVFKRRNYQLDKHPYLKKNLAVMKDDKEFNETGLNKIQLGEEANKKDFVYYYDKATSYNFISNVKKDKLEEFDTTLYFFSAMTNTKLEGVLDDATYNTQGRVEYSKNLGSLTKSSNAGEQQRKSFSNRRSSIQNRFAASVPTILLNKNPSSLITNIKTSITANTNKPAILTFTNEVGEEITIRLTSKANITQAKTTNKLSPTHTPFNSTLSKLDVYVGYTCSPCSDSTGKTYNGKGRASATKISYYKNKNNLGG